VTHLSSFPLSSLEDIQRYFRLFQTIYRSNRVDRGNRARLHKVLRQALCTRFRLTEPSSLRVGDCSFEFKALQYSEIVKFGKTFYFPSLYFVLYRVKLSTSRRIAVVNSKGLQPTVHIDNTSTVAGDCGSGTSFVPRSHVEFILPGIR
jgi:hypothetical protein